MKLCINSPSTGGDMVESVSDGNVGKSAGNSSQNSVPAIRIDTANTPTNQPANTLDNNEEVLSKKIQRVFDLPSSELFVTEYPCWLIRNILLKGRIFLTTYSICFYSHLRPMDCDDSVQMEGYLYKQSISKSFYKYWFTLKDGVLSFFNTAEETYFPVGSVELKNVIAVEVASVSGGTCGSGGILKLQTTKKKYVLQSDNLQEMQDWRTAIEKAAFRSRHTGDCVKFVIPLQSLVDMSLVRSNAFGDAIVLKVQDRDDSDYDEYFFANLRDAKEVFTQLTKLADFCIEGSDDVTHKPQQQVQLKQNNRLSQHDEAGEDQSSGLWVLRYLSLRKQKTVSGPQQQQQLQPVEQKSDLHKMFPSIQIGKIILTSSVYLFTGPASYSLPRFGKLYLTHDHILFHSRLVGLRTRAVIPVGDVKEIKRVDKYLGFWYGIYLKLRNGEIWVEFRSLDQREKFILFLRQQQIDEHNSTSGLSSPPKQRSGTEINLGNGNYDFSLDFIGGEDDDGSGAAEMLRQRKGSLASSLLEEIHKRDDKFQKQQVSIDSPPAAPAKLANVQSSTASDEDPKTAPKSQNSGKVFGEKLKITLFTIGSRGDVQPMIALGKGLKACGHTVYIATHAEFREWIESHGLECREVSGNPADLMQLCVEHGMFTVSFLSEAFSKFRVWIDELFCSSVDALTGSDVIIESPVSMVGYHIAQKLAVPYFGSCPMPWTRTAEFPHPFAASPDRLSNRWWRYDQMTWTLIETLMWRGLKPQVNRFRKKVLGIRPLSSGNWYEDDKIPFLYCFSPAVVPKPADWKPYVNVCGYWFLDEASTKKIGDEKQEEKAKWTPPDSLLRFLNDEQSGKPIVYIGFGSMVVSDPAELTKTIITAVKEAGVRAVISKGWSARGQKVAQPTAAEIEDPDIYFLTSVPHDWLFPRVAAVMHHGGAGTTAAGLRYGCPTVINPFFGDQFFWASRVSQLGVGLYCKKLRVDYITESLLRAVNDDSMRAKAIEVSQKMAGEDGVQNAIEIIHKNIPILRDRISKRPPVDLETFYGSKSSNSAYSSSRFVSISDVNEMIELEDLTNLTILRKSQSTPQLIETLSKVTFPQSPRQIKHVKSTETLSPTMSGCDSPPRPWSININSPKLTSFFHRTSTESASSTSEETDDKSPLPPLPISRMSTFAYLSPDGLDEHMEVCQQKQQPALKKSRRPYQRHKYVRSEPTIEHLDISQLIESVEQQENFSDSGDGESPSSPRLRKRTSIFSRLFK